MLPASGATSCIRLATYVPDSSPGGFPAAAARETTPSPPGATIVDDEVGVARPELVGEGAGGLDRPPNSELGIPDAGGAALALPRLDPGETGAGTGAGDPFIAASRPYAFILSLDIRTRG